MPVPDVGSEATRAVGYGGIAVLVVKGAEMLAKAFGVSRTLHASELEATMKTAASIREELRGDNERLRHRNAELENENEKLKDARGCWRTSRS